VGSKAASLFDFRAGAWFSVTALFPVGAFGWRIDWNRELFFLVVIVPMITSAIASGFLAPRMNVGGEKNDRSVFLGGIAALISWITDCAIVVIHDSSPLRAASGLLMASVIILPLFVLIGMISGKLFYAAAVRKRAATVEV